MGLSVKRRFIFHAAHFLPGHKGKCKSMHGHTYTLDVSVSGFTGEDGMLIDFSDLKDIIGPVVDVYDHCILNDHLDFAVDSPTVENLIAAFWEYIVEALKSKSFEGFLYRLELWETPECSAVLDRE